MRMSGLSKNNQVLKNCNFSKTVLMILVVFYHSIVFWTGTWFSSDPVFESNFLGLLAEYIGSFHIYAFALVSGYIFAYKISGGGTVTTCHSFKIRRRGCLSPMFL